jgi:hypothetical protein
MVEISKGIPDAQVVNKALYNLGVEELKREVL